MTRQEEKILKIIIENPEIEQVEIAKLLGIKRSTVAVHISSLIKQGYIKGKGYILNKESYVLGIGACNVDIYGKSQIKIKTHYDHPAKIYSSVGGVTKNILSNYSLLGGNAKLITAIGEDNYGKSVIDDCNKYGIDTSNVLICKNKSTGIFMQIQDENNDMYLALCDMSAVKDITPEYLRNNRKIILSANLVLCDPSLNNETIEELINICADKVPIFVDPISDNYALKIKPYIEHFTCIKPNKTELENLSDMKINNLEDVEKACKKLLNQGLKSIYVSLGPDGILYMDNNTSIKSKLKPVKKMINASGAGDAVVGTIIYGYINNYEVKDTVKYALAAGKAAIMCEDTINQNLSITYLDKIIKEK